MKEPRVRRASLGLLASIFALLAIALAVGGFTYYRREARDIQAEKYQELHTIATLKIAQIEAWRSERLSDARLNASRVGLKEHAARWAAHPLGESLAVEIRRDMGIIRDFHGYQNILLLNLDGRHLLSLDPRASTAEPHLKTLAALVTREGRASLGDLFRCEACGQVHLDAAAPVLGTDGKTLALLVLRSDPEVLLYPLIQSWPTPSRTAETLLVRREGNQVRFLNRLRHQDYPALSFTSPLTQGHLPAAQAVMGRTGESLGQDYRGVQVLADLLPIPNTPWYMVAKVDTQEILAEIRYRGGVILGFTALGILMIGVLLGFLFYFGQAKLYQDLFQATRFQGDSEYPFKAPMAQRGRHLAQSLGYFGIALGGLGLMGWAFDSPILKSGLPGLVTMKANTAIGLLLAGSGLQLSRWPRLKSAQGICAGVLILLGALTLAQYFFGWDFRIDQAFFQEPAGTIGTLAPGRMAPASALNFILFGCGLSLAGGRRTAAASHWLALAVALLGLLAFLTVLYGPVPQRGVGHYLQMALPTSLAFMVLGLGLFLLNPAEGFVKRLTTASMGGWLLRRTVLLAPAVSVLFGWALVAGEKLGWFEPGMGLALFVTTFVCLLWLATWWAARSLDLVDSIRRQAEARAWESAEEIRATLYGIGDGVIATDASGQVIHLNPVAERLTGWTETEALGRPLEEIFRIISEETLAGIENPVAQILRGHQAIELPRHTLLVARDGTHRAIADSGAPVLGEAGGIVRVVLVFRDQTAERRTARLTQIRIDLNDYSTSHSLEELLTRTLDITEGMVDSPIAFYHFYDEDTGTVQMQQWSTRTRREFCRAEGQGTHHPLDRAGVWVDCVRKRQPVIHSDCASLPNEKGLPPGHAALSRELVVPVFRGDKIVALLGVGNKATDYTEQDLQTVGFLAEATWTIVERKLAEQSLREAERMARGTLDALSKHIAILDASGTLLAVNAAWRRFGEENPPLLHPACEGANYFEVCAAATGPDSSSAWAFAEGIRDVMEGRLNEYTQEYACHSPQEKRWFVGRVTRFAGEGPLRVVVAHENITARKIAEGLLHSKTELMDITGRMAKVGGWEFDTTTLKGTWTDEVARIHDLDPAQESSVELGVGFYTEDSRPKILKAIQEAVELGIPYDLELELMSAKGIHKTVHTIGNPVMNEEGKVVLVRGIFQDITERKAAEMEAQRLILLTDQSRRALLSLLEDQRVSSEEIRRLNAELEERVQTRTLELASANKELDAFAYSVSHDLRAPLRHMDGFLSMLVDHLGGNLDEKGAHYLEVARKANRRMGMLVEGLLSFSRLGRTELNLVPVDTAHLISSVIEEFKPECEGRRVLWRVGALPELQGDPTLLRLVFQNLVGNSLKFTRGRSEAVIEIQANEGLEGETVLSIRDNGVGFDPAYSHKLFGVFQRLHREDEFEGTGIGLANVHRIVTRHGGRVWAEGRLGEGATFCIALPSKERTP